MAGLTLLVGHRGTGKSQFLESLRAHPSFATTKLLDLDTEITRISGRPVSEVFRAQGEAAFRDWERKVLSHLALESKSAVVAVGAGFKGPIPIHAHVVWLRRATDAFGRVFLNRPRLNKTVSPFAEYMERFPARERRYREWAHEELLLPEGYEHGLEDFLIEATHRDLPFALTLLPEHIRALDHFWAKRKNWNLKWIELRDDLLSEAQIQQALATLPAERVLYSRRTTAGKAPKAGAIDWALELGAPHPQADIVSLHQRHGDFEETLRQLSKHAQRGRILKLAVEVNTFAELREGYEWWNEDRQARAFLPRSADGRWRWFRILFGREMPLNFFREGQGSALDQPTLWDVCHQPRLTSGFAAVLGDPVEHSRSPVEHKDWAAARGWPFVAIKIREEEFTAALPHLKAFGLKAAAVTAPLKALAFAAAAEASPEARALGAANTLVYKDHRVSAHNTDVLALRELAKSRHGDEVWLWGGGGTKAAVLAAWPNAKAVSAREGFSGAGSPDLVIWAVGRARPFKFPSASVRPGFVLDLNYGEDSPGLEWAARMDLPYQSGLKMFKLQAEFQRRYWSEHV